MLCHADYFDRNVVIDVDNRIFRRNPLRVKSHICRYRIGKIKTRPYTIGIIIPACKDMTSFYRDLARICQRRRLCHCLRRYISATTVYIKCNSIRSPLITVQPYLVDVWSKFSIENHIARRSGGDLRNFIPIIRVAVPTLESIAKFFCRSQYHRIFNGILCWIIVFSISNADICNIIFNRLPFCIDKNLAVAALHNGVDRRFVLAVGIPS